MKLFFQAIVLACSASITYSVFAGSCPQPMDVRQASGPGFLAMNQQSVQANPKNPVKIPLYLPNEVKRASVELVTADGDVVRNLPLSSLESGIQKVLWDGLDSEGIPVPSEVYTPILRIDEGLDSAKVVDPRIDSGGEIIAGLGRNWDWTGGRDITFNLPAPARVLARIGVKNGPVLKNLSHWAPKPAGKVVLRWDGYDQDGLTNLSDRTDISVLVMGYCLPHASIIVYGNDAMDYFSYRQKKGWPMKRVDQSKLKLHRNGYRLEKDYFLPRLSLPKITIEPEGGAESTSPQVYELTTKTNLKISVAQEDRWVLDSAFYEIVYFKDYQFLQEEEQGFLPIYWPIEPVNLNAGRHIFTAQISAFNGIYVSRSIEIQK